MLDQVLLKRPLNKYDFVLFNTLIHLKHIVTLLNIYWTCSSPDPQVQYNLCGTSFFGCLIHLCLNTLQPSVLVLQFALLHLTNWRRAHLCAHIKCPPSACCVCKRTWEKCVGCSLLPHQSTVVKFSLTSAVVKVYNYRVLCNACVWHYIIKCSKG